MTLPNERPDAKAGSHVTFLSCSFPQFGRDDMRGVAVGEIGGRRRSGEGFIYEATMSRT